MGGSTSFQKTALWLIGALIAIAFGAFMFLGGYAVRMQTHKDTTVAAATAAGQPAASGAHGFGVLDEIYAALNQYYVDPSKLQDFNALRQGAIDGLLNTVGDVNQTYIRPEDIQATNTDISGQFEGIGATIAQKNGEVSIAALIPDTPAAGSKLRIGDVLLAVDGQDMKGKTSSQVVAVVRGPAGSPVKLHVRHTDGTQEDVTITRASIKLISTHTEQLKDANGNPVNDIAYLRIDQFQDTTDAEVAKYLTSIQGKSYKGFILDLRGNPGGALVPTLHILDDLLNKPGQVELIERDRNGQETVHKAAKPAAGLDTSIPMVVLVNKGSASASEVTSGALHDNNRATIMGEQTYGKGTVNTFVPLKQDGGELYVSIADWLTPNRNQIEGVGITPDVVVHLGPNDDVNSTFNAQLYAAIDRLHSGS